MDLAATNIPRTIVVLREYGATLAKRCVAAVSHENAACRMSNLPLKRIGLRLTRSNPAQEGTMAQPYKGDRQSVTSKIPREQAKQLDRVVRLTSETRSELIARLLDEYLRNFDFSAFENTQELPIRQAS